jgi:hypothetical protein
MRSITSEYSLRPRRPRDYGHLHTVLEHTVFTQHSVKKGLQLYGEDGAKAVLQELQQLHDWNVIEPMDPSNLSPEQKREALQCLMFLQQK